MTAVYGVGQAVFVAARSWAPDLTTLWSGVVLAVLLAVGVVWAGTEVVLGRRPEEWTWFRAALAAAPGAGLLSWILVALFVDASGVADLGAALVGRAAFTALLVLGSATVGSRLGWLSLRRRGEGADDPAFDRDESDPALARAGRAEFGGAARPPSLDPRTVARVARLRQGGDGADRDRADAPEPSVAGVRPRRAPRGPSESPSEVDVPASTHDLAAVELPFEAPVVAVLPETTDLPTRPAGGGRDEAAEEGAARPCRRGFGLRRPSS